MKRTFIALTTLSIFNIVTPAAHAKGSCEKMQDYRHVIQKLREDIEVLVQERHNVLYGEDYPSSNIYEMEPSTIFKPGSQLLREQEEWIDSLEKISDKQNDSILYGSISSALLPILGYLNYEAWKAPQSSKQVFLEIFFRNHPVHIASRVMLGLFALHMVSKTVYHGIEYYDLHQDAKDAKLKIETLEKLADIEDSIAAKKRMKENLDIQSKLLTENCSPSPPTVPPPWSSRSTMSSSDG